MYSAQELVSRVETLISLPAVYYRIREELDSPDASLDKLGKLIVLDPALSARLLSIVNSALYGYRQIDSVIQAIQLLGLKKVHDLALAMCASTVFDRIRPKEMNMQLFWNNSVICGIAAQHIAQKSTPSTADRMFTIGLLADLGHLVIYQTVPELAEQALRTANENKNPLYQTERQIIGCDYTEAGAALMTYWRLPLLFAEIIGSQATPKLAGSHQTEAFTLHLASHITQTSSKIEDKAPEMMPLDPLVWEQLKISPDEIDTIRAQASNDFSLYITHIFPDRNASSLSE